MKYLLMCVAVLTMTACGGEDKSPENEAPQPAAPLAKSQNSDAFNASFRQLLDHYFALKDALVASKDTAAAAVNTSAMALVGSADSLRLLELKADEALLSTARSYVQGMSAEAKGLVGEKELEKKRRSFQMISGQLYDLMRTVQYDREIVYHQYCPMAFNDEGADWLSRSSDIRNPYFGSRMLTCGEVKDSLDFTRGK